MTRTTKTDTVATDVNAFTAAWRGLPTVADRRLVRALMLRLTARKAVRP
jgi:hypothetical protein